MSNPKKAKADPNADATAKMKERQRQRSENSKAHPEADADTAKKANAPEQENIPTQTASTGLKWRDNLIFIDLSSTKIHLNQNEHHPNPTPG
jgi:hypothetical protein